MLINLRQQYIDDSEASVLTEMEIGIFNITENIIGKIKSILSNLKNSNVSGFKIYYLVEDLEKIHESCASLYSLKRQHEADSKLLVAQP